MNNRKRVETIIECLNEELKQTEKTIAELEEKKEMAIGEPVQFLESVLNSNMKLTTCSYSVKGLPPAVVKSVIARSRKRPRPSSKPRLSNSHLDLVDIRKRLNEYMPRTRLKIKVPIIRDLSGNSASNSPISPFSAFPIDSPINMQSTLAPWRPSTPKIGQKTVHFTKTRVSGGFYLCEGARRLMHPVNYEKSTTSAADQTASVNDVTYHLDQICSISPDKIATEEFDELCRLLKMKHVAKNRKANNEKFMIHSGYRCDGCEREPIMGVRWTCIDCPFEKSIDLCDSCFWKRHKIELKSDCHSFSHRFREATLSHYWDESFDYLNPE